MGAVGICFDDALMESFRSRVQVELLDRQAWSTYLEPVTALFEYLETFHNRQRRHSSFGMLIPILLAGAVCGDAAPPGGESQIRRDHERLV